MKSVTYVVSPRHSIYPRVRHYVALEIDVHSLVDIVAVDFTAKFQSNDRYVCKKKKKNVCKTAFEVGKITPVVRVGSFYGIAGEKNWTVFTREYKKKTVSYLRSRTRG